MLWLTWAAFSNLHSNGIRFSISDLTPPAGRILPTVHAYRVGISLYNAQFDPKTGERRPISRYVIRSVIGAILRFQVTCFQFGVLPGRIRIVATEAMRTAINSDGVVREIEDATTLRIEILDKSHEGRLGAWGIASGFSDVEGLAVDLGGGSMQITWVVSHAGDLHMSPEGSLSFPYGAGALSKKLSELQKGRDKEADRAVKKFQQEMKRTFLDAYEKLQIPESLVDKARKEGGFQLYMSGGGFRGWGYLLLYLHQTRGRHYPISIINGYRAGRDEFANTRTLKEVARTAHKIFRVSDHRRKQVPAVAFLVNALAESVPYGIKEARFCQGGIREGILYSQLTPVIRQQDPLEVATSSFRKPSAGLIGHFFLAATPPPAIPDSQRCWPNTLNVHLIQSFANVLYAHAYLPKELASTTALYSTSTGILAYAHGISHEDRARLALLLEDRYDGELPPREDKVKSELRSLLTPEEVWWISYMARIGLVVGKLYPTGIMDSLRPRVWASARLVTDLGKKGDKFGVELTFTMQHLSSDQMRTKEALERMAKKIEKVGKKKNWIGGRTGWGMKVKVVIVVTEISTGR